MGFKGIYNKILTVFMCLIAFDISRAEDPDFDFDNLKEDDYLNQPEPAKSAPVAKKKVPAKSETTANLEQRIKDTREKVTQAQAEINAEDRTQKEEIKEILRLQAQLKGEMNKLSRLKHTLTNKQSETKRLREKAASYRQQLNRRPSNQ